MLSTHFEIKSTYIVDVVVQPGGTAYYYIQQHSRTLSLHLRSLVRVYICVLIDGGYIIELYTRNAALYTNMNQTDANARI